MSESITTPSGWKIYNTPIPFHQWEGYIMGSVSSGKIVRYRSVWKMPDGTTQSQDQISLISEVNSNGIISYESEGIKFWEFPILYRAGKNILPECFIIAATDALLPIVAQFREEAKKRYCVWAN